MKLLDYRPPFNAHQDRRTLRRMMVRYMASQEFPSTPGLAIPSAINTLLSLILNTLLT